MRVHLRYYALVREELNRDEDELDLAEGSTVNDLIEAVGLRYPNVKTHLSYSRIASSEAYLVKNDRLVEGEHYSVIPPVSGG